MYPQVLAKSLNLELIFSGCAWLSEFCDIIFVTRENGIPLSTVFDLRYLRLYGRNNFICFPLDDSRHVILTDSPLLKELTAISVKRNKITQEWTNNHSLKRTNFPLVMCWILPVFKVITALIINNSNCAVILYTWEDWLVMWIEYNVSQ